MIYIRGWFPVRIYLLKKIIKKNRPLIGRLFYTERTVINLLFYPVHTTAPG